MKAPKPSESAGRRLRQAEKSEAHRSQAAEIQHLKDSRAQLRDVFGRYNALYDLVPLGFLALDRSGRILDLNDKAAGLLAFPADWLFHRPFVVFVAKDDVRRFLAFLTRSLQISEQQTIELDLFVDGRLVPVQISMRSVSHGDTLIHHMTVFDLTETKRIERQLQEALDNWHSLIESAADVIMTVDRSGKISFVNRPAWGCSVRTLLGTNLEDYVSEQHRSKLKKCILQAFSSDKRSTCEVTGVGEQNDRWYSFSFGSVQSISDGGQKRTTTVMIREISEHKRAEDLLRSSGDQLREFAAKLEAVREEERTRVAREIHDELGQALTIIKLDLSWLRTKTPREEADRRKKLKSVIDHVDLTIERVREIVSELRPSILDDLGLIAAIEWQLAQFQERTGIQAGFESSIEKLDFSPEVAAAIFRVVQEALTNVVRHAKASKVSIRMNSSGAVLSISIEDNGKGITAGQISDLRSLGIVGMTERMHRIQGEFRIHSRPGQGTRIDITVSIP